MVGQTLVIKGQYRMTVLKGAVSILGAVVHSSPKSYPVFAPQTHALPVIECVNVQDSIMLEDTIIPDSIDYMTSQYRAIIQIDDFYSGYESISRLVPVYKSLWSGGGSFPMASQPGTSKRSYELLLSAPESTVTFHAFDSWHDICTKILITADTHHSSSSSPVMLITGPKSSGKSTFCRFISNFMLSRVYDCVYYLELDPGQPEYCPPGTISLHFLNSNAHINLGPPFTHCGFENVVKAHSIGDTSLQNQPSQFLAYTKDLLKVYQSTLTQQQVPLIINTPGWTRGMGLELIYEIASASNPQLVVHLGSDDSKIDVQYCINSETPFYAIESKSMSLPNGIGTNTGSSLLRYTAADSRILQVMSYFHRGNFNNHLTEMTPYQVPYHSSSHDTDQLITGISGVGILDNEGILLQDCLTCLNASVVSIIVVDCEVSFSTILTPENLPWLDSSNLSIVLEPGHSCCLGYGVVQSIDEINECIRLLTPINMNVIGDCLQKEKKIILIRGRLSLPVWELYNSKLKQKAPYLSETRKQRTRRYLTRRGRSDR